MNSLAFPSRLPFATCSNSNVVTALRTIVGAESHLLHPHHLQLTHGTAHTFRYSNVPAAFITIAITYVLTFS